MDGIKDDNGDYWKKRCNRGNDKLIRPPHIHIFVDEDSSLLVRFSSLNNGVSISCSAYDKSGISYLASKATVEKVQGQGRE